MSVRASGRLAGRHIDVPENEVKRTRPEIAKLREDREAKQKEGRAAVARAEKEAADRSAKRVADEEDREALDRQKTKSFRPDLADGAGLPTISAAIPPTYAQNTTAPPRGLPRRRGVPAGRDNYSIPTTGRGTAASGRGAVPTSVRRGVPIPLRGGARARGGGDAPTARGRGSLTARGRGAVTAGRGAVAGRGRGTSGPHRESIPPDDSPIQSSYDKTPGGHQPDRDSRPASRMDTSADNNSRPSSRMDIIKPESPIHEDPLPDPNDESTAAVLYSPSRSRQGSPRSSGDALNIDKSWTDPLLQPDGEFYDSEGPPPGSEMGDFSEGVSSEGGVDNEDDEGKARYQRRESLGDYGEAVYDDDMASSGSEFQPASDEERDEKDEHGAFDVDSEDVGSAAAELERSIAEMQAKVAALRGNKAASSKLPEAKSRPKAASKSKSKDKMAIRTAVAEQRASKNDGTVNGGGGGKKRVISAEDDGPEPETSAMR
ncbi:hypothetical protein BDZ89DRAFT_1152594 [Hymenopellis radicata]|nr:hypothetical protein BDZ89DRAFT_1152594 [Hymenopellis radicata]